MDLLLLMAAVVFGFSGSEIGLSSRMRTEPYRFIAAFEVSVENRFAFVWPHEAMPSADYVKVLVAVGKMPLIRNPGTLADDWAPMRAARDLHINGQVRNPYRGVRPPTAGAMPQEPEMFLIDLERGRIRLSLVIPAGFIVHPQRKTAQIILYEPAGRRAGRLSTVPARAAGAEWTKPPACCKKRASQSRVIGQPRAGTVLRGLRYGHRTYRFAGRTYVAHCAALRFRRLAHHLL